MSESRSPAELTALTRRTLAGVWAYRVGAESEAEDRFRRLALQLAEVDAVAVAVDFAEQAVKEEQRHIAICRDMAERHGHRFAPAEPSLALPLGPSRLAPRDRLLYEVVAFCCVTETINASLMAVTYERARAPAARRAVREILKDEVRHSRIGWAHLGSERALGRGGFITGFLPRMIAGAVSEELFAPPAPEETRDPLLVEHGELPLSVRAEVFESTLRDVLLPGFEREGIDTGPARAWHAAARSGLATPRRLARETPFMSRAAV